LVAYAVVISVWAGSGVVVASGYATYEIIGEVMAS